MKDKLKIAFTINHAFLMPFSVALHSLLENNKGHIEKIYLFCDFLSGDEKLKLQKIISDFQVEMQCIEVDDAQLEKLVTTLHFNKTNYYRLLIPELIAEKKILYLDADILVLGSLMPIWEVNLEDNYLAAVWTPGVEWHPELGVSKKDGYFNSGVMLINLDKWRAENLGQKTIQFVKDNPRLIWFVDQCGLNALTKSKWVKIPLKYNLTVDVYEGIYHESDPGVDMAEIRKAIEDPVIVHFSGTSKPWHTSNQHPYKWKFWKYLWKTPYSRLLPQDFCVTGVVKYLTPKSVRSFFRKIQYRYFPRGKFKWK
jgi:lipopolysaccharide biosynthesis glycosyltransferase